MIVVGSVAGHVVLAAVEAGQFAVESTGVDEAGLGVYKSSDSVLIPRSWVAFGFAVTHYWHELCYQSEHDPLYCAYVAVISSSSSSYISSFTTSDSVTLNARPVRRLWISDALRADSILASRLLSLLREAAM
jgi:hypothetical protein